MDLETCGLDEAPTSPTWLKSLADDAASRMCQVHMWESLVNYYWQWKTGEASGETNVTCVEIVSSRLLQESQSSLIDILSKPTCMLVSYLIISEEHAVCRHVGSGIKNARASWSDAMILEPREAFKSVGRRVLVWVWNYKSTLAVSAWLGPKARRLMIIFRAVNYVLVDQAAPIIGGSPPKPPVELVADHEIRRVLREAGRRVGAGRYSKSARRFVPRRNHERPTRSRRRFR